MSTKYAYAVIAGTRSKPNGRVGMFQTRAEADVARTAERQTTFIFRETISMDLWESLSKKQVKP